MASGNRGFGRRGGRGTATARGLLWAGAALGSLLAGGCGTVAVAQPSPADLAPVLQAVVDMAVSQGSFQGVSVGVDFGNDARWLGAGGYRDIARTQPLSPIDQFRIGSHSKTFTGTAILQLLDQGRVGLNDTLTRWVPELNVPNGNIITIHNLLTMTSGLPDYLVAKSIRNPAITVLVEWSNFTSPTHDYADAAYTPQQLVEAVVNDTSLAYSPIGQMRYSNTNFVLLGIIAQKASAASLSVENQVNGGIAAPLGMVNTLFPTGRDFTAAYAENAQFVMSGAAFGVPDDTSYNVTRADPRVPWAAGAVISNPADELTWVRQLVLNDRNLLTPQTQLQRMEAPAGGSVAYIPARYGMALYYMPSVGTGTELVGHSGQIGGYTSSIFYSPSLNVGFAVNFSGLQANASSWFPLYGADPLYGQEIREGGSLTSVPILWTLERNLRIAMQAQGSCSAIGPIAGGSLGDPYPLCSGDSARTQPLPLTRAALTVQPSNRTIGNYVITSDTTMDSVQVPRPSVAFFGSRMAGFDLRGGSSLTLQPGSITEMTGTDSAAVSVNGAGNQVTVQGEIRAYGTGTVAVRVGGDGGEPQAGDPQIGQGAVPAGGSGGGNPPIGQGAGVTGGSIGQGAAPGGGTGGSQIVIAPGATVQGDVVIVGSGNTVRIDGTLVGNLVLQPGSSARLSGGGTITGTLTGGGTLTADSETGALKVGPRLALRAARKEGPGRPTRIIGVP